jgi:hypothetical protein
MVRRRSGAIPEPLRVNRYQKLERSLTGNPAGVADDRAML